MYETPLSWEKHCELIPEEYALCQSRLHSLIKRSGDPGTLQEYDSSQTASI